jgi:hypothetical protein
VVAENGKSLGGYGAGGDMEHRGGSLASDLVHVGDHEKQTLGGGKGGRKGARGEGSVDRPGRSGLGLHLDDLRKGSPEVLAAHGRKLIGQLSHRGGGSDGIDRDNFGTSVGDIRRRGVTIDHHHVLGICHCGSFF